MAVFSTGLSDYEKATAGGGVEPSKTVSEFCAAEKMSKAKLYQDWREGRGPRYYLVGSHRRISPEAHREYRRQREAEAAQARAAAHAPEQS